MSRVRAIAAVSALLVASVAAPASANRFVDTSVNFADDGLDVEIRAETALGRPRVRTERGFIRVWFPSLSPANLDFQGDGEAIRFVRLRPGYENTGLAVIRLTNMRRVASRHVEVSRDGNIAHIRVSRIALGLAPAAAQEPPTEAAATEGEESETEGTDDAAATESATTSGAAAAATTPAPETAASTRPRPSAAPLPATSGPSTMTLLIGLTLLLGGAYLALRYRQKGKNFKDLPHIEVVTSKRLSSRHQLLVVRALGEDHLLSVHGGRTERIASVRSAASEGRGNSFKSELEDLPFLQLGREGEEADRSLLHRTQTREERPRFGAELMRMVAERTRNDDVSISRAPAGGTSEAVAGLLRLREKLSR